MKVIHQGTQVVSSFSVVDGDGNVLQTLNVTPAQPGQNQEQKEDPLRIQVFKEENFVKAFQALVNVKQNIERQLAQGQTVQAAAETEEG